MKGNEKLKNTKTTFTTIDEFTELGYFTKNAAGKLELSDKSVPPAIDMHTHLGFATGLAPKVDLTRRSDSVRHSFSEHGMAVDMSIYSGINLTRENRKGLFRDFAEGAFFGTGAAATYTAPNLVDEMDRMGVERSILLAMDIPGSCRVSEAHIAAAESSHGRLIPFCGISPRSLFWERHVEKCISLGARGMKYHPYINFMGPDHPMAVKLFRKWSRSGLPIIFHTSHNGVEPAMLRRYSDMELYRTPLRKLPDATFIFGHAGMGNYREAAAMAKEHGNTFLEIGGQPPEVVKELIDIIGPDRLLYGSDWPVYPFALPLAKILIATEGDPDSRRKILHDNADALLARTAARQSA